MTSAPPAAPSDVRLLRQALIALGVLGVLGTAVELVLERHWQSWVQGVPWVALCVLTVALALLIGRPTYRTVGVARVLAAIVILSAGWGVVEHVIGNYDAGPLDFRYSDRWAAMSASSRWWAAVTKSVGPAPPLAPLALAHSALAGLLATVRHPARRRGDGARLRHLLAAAAGGEQPRQLPEGPPPALPPPKDPPAPPAPRALPRTWTPRSAPPPEGVPIDAPARRRRAGSGGATGRRAARRR